MSESLHFQRTPECEKHSVYMNANMYRCLFLDGKADQFPQRDECKENNVLYFVRFERIFLLAVSEFQKKIGISVQNLVKDSTRGLCSFSVNSLFFSKKAYVPKCDVLNYNYRAKHI